MVVFGWLSVIVLFLVGMVGAIYPILPGALTIYAAFLVYGLCISFEPFGFMFWTIETVIVAALFIADYVANVWGIKRFKGSKASIIGSTIGIIIGPFVIPVLGLILGPFLGALIGEMMTGTNLDKSMKSATGAVVGLFMGIIVKLALQVVMIVLFFIWIFTF